MSRVAVQTVRVPNTDVFTGDMLLICPGHPLRSPLGAERLAAVAPGVLMEKKAAGILGRVMQAVGARGRIAAVSGHRTRAEQEAIFAGALAAHGQDYANTYVALPDCSEHQSGLAVDMALTGGAIDPITPAFPYVGICQAFRQTALRYGFIQRYPAGKEHLTRIGHEPWHFRYVGLPHAGLMAHLGLTLEEYTDWLRSHRHGKNPHLWADGAHAWEVGFVPAGGGGFTEIEVTGRPYTCSGNNVDGFVLAVWRS